MKPLKCGIPSKPVMIPESMFPPLKLLILQPLFVILPLTVLLKSVSACPHNINNIPSLTPFNKQTILSLTKNPDKIFSASPANDLEDYKIYYYNQTLDHFNYGPQNYATFRQKYVINLKSWGGANSSSPIFAYLGAEEPIDGDIGILGFLSDNSPYFKALEVYIEHRFYGDSIPLGSMEEAMKNESIRGYFNSAQAIADYAEVLLHVKQTLSAHKSPIIVIGGSYGGMLASWFRLKYPHVALGALASSAPILYFDNITPQNGYYSIVTKDFKEASENCYQTIKKSWSEIQRVASQPNGLSTLSQRFKTCSQLNNTSELENFLEITYAEAAQYNHPPNYPVTMVCRGIDAASSKGTTDIIGRIFAGLVSYRGNITCYDTNTYNYPSQTNIGWGWQTCSEMVMPVGIGENDTMFPADPFSLTQFIKDCKGKYGVSPRPHWVTTYYGGHDIKLSLHRFGSNIIFSNGLRDPYSSGGVLEDISESILAVSTANGSHCLDLLIGQNTDPEWLVTQRNTEVKIIEGWLTKYYADLEAFKK